MSQCYPSGPQQINRQDRYTPQEKVANYITHKRIQSPCDVLQSLKRSLMLPAAPMPHVDHLPTHQPIKEMSQPSNVSSLIIKRMTQYDSPYSPDHPPSMAADLLLHPNHPVITFLRLLPCLMRVQSHHLDLPCLQT